MLVVVFFHSEVILLHNWTLHRSLTNTTEQPRRGFSVCYIDAETRQRRAPERESIQLWPQVFPDFRPVVVVGGDVDGDGDRTPPGASTSKL